MPGGKRQRIYWDANCFISLINRDPVWFSTLEILFDDANIHGTIQLYTSVLSITEVAFFQMERLQGAFDARAEAELDRFWATNKGLALVDYSEVVAREARRIRREDILVRGWKGYRTPDLIHLASAVRMQVSEMHTTDKRLHRYGKELGFSVGDPFTAKMRLPGV